MARKRAEAQPAKKAELTFATPLIFVCENLDAQRGTRELLYKMIEAMGLTYEQFAIVNTSQLHSRQLQAQAIICFGESASKALVSKVESLEQIRGTFRTFQGIPILATHDLAYLLTHPASKRETWQDLQAVAKKLGLTIPTKKA